MYIHSVSTHLCISNSIMGMFMIANCNEAWTVGKVTQFALHKQKSKSDKQYKKPEAPV